jgi:L-alanine-DL-glutamate epimerase-like enolase superfamily enzyme
MIRRTLSARIERFPVAGSFTIARGAKTHVDVVVAEIVAGRHIGRGEATAIYYRGESAETALAGVTSTSDAIEAGIGRTELQALLPAGAARNAVDAALWDLEAKQSGRRVWDLIGLPRPAAVLTAYTLSLAEPAVMEAAARQAAHRELLKLKLAGDDGDIDRVAAVRKGAPAARLIVDANESWGEIDVAAAAAALLPYRVELIEQPVPAGADHLLERVASPIPLCADESLHDLASLDACLGRYHLINIKLDKAGGLTEALRLVRAARAAGIGIMTGCMLSTSLGIAPAFLVAAQSQYADLDGPLLLAKDRPHAMRFEGSDVFPPETALWG